MAEAQWYYAVDGKQHGPVPSAELKQLTTAGKLNKQDLVWKEGTPDWVAAGTVPGLFASEAAATAPASTATTTGTAEAGARATASSTRPPDLKAQARQVASEASRDAMLAFKTLLSNPVGGLKAAYDSLGKMRAMWVGLVFALIFYLCVVIGMWMLYVDLVARFGPPPPRVVRPPVEEPGMGITGFLLLLLLGAVPWIATAAASALSRKIFRGAGSIEADAFIAGASLLPFGLFVLVAGMLGLGTPLLVFSLGIAAICFTVLMLYSGCTNILRIPEAAATLAVPLIVVISSLVSLQLVKWMIF